MAATRPRRAAGTVSYREYEEHEVFREDAKGGKGKAESERASKRPERQRIKKSAREASDGESLEQSISKASPLRLSARSELEFSRNVI